MVPDDASSIREQWDGANPPFPFARFVSLWDMLRFNVEAFTKLLLLLEAMRELIPRLSAACERRGESDTQPRDAVTSRLRNTLVDATKVVAAKLNELEDLCNDLGMSLTIRKIARVQKTLAEDEGLDALSKELEVLIERVVDELRGRVFMYLTPAQVAQFEATAPFGVVVQKKFPGLGTDIGEASQCLACERWTAAVFHLMRVMEGGLRKLARLVKVTPGTNPNWGTVIPQIESKIATLPHGTAKERKSKDQFSELAAYLRNVKDAWRNPVMHVDRLYLRDEAVSIFDAVKAFMTAMAKFR